MLAILKTKTLKPPGAGMTAQQLRSPIALAKDLSLVLWTHVKGIPMTHNSRSKRSNPPLWHSCMFPHTDTHACTQLKNKSSKEPVYQTDTINTEGNKRRDTWFLSPVFWARNGIRHKDRHTNTNYNKRILFGHLFLVIIFELSVDNLCYAYIFT